MIYVIIFTVGAINALIWARYIKFVTEHRKAWSAIYDGLLLTAQYGMLQVWSALDNDWRVTAAWIVSNAIGTYFAVGRKRG